MATQTIYTHKDTHVDSRDPLQNFGGSLYLSIRTVSGVAVDQGLIGFDITSAPAAASVSNVLVYLLSNYTQYGRHMDFRQVTGSWTELGVWWDNKPATTDVNKVNCAMGPGLGDWYSYDVTNLYKAAKTAGNDFSINLQITNTNAVYHISPKDASWTYRAYIVITYSVGTDFYVKTTGNDSKSGDSWADAWKTVNKAATTVVDGSTVHIGFGNYTAEPAGNKIAPQNIGANGIKYLPEAVGGGGVGTVKVIKN